MRTPYSQMIARRLYELASTRMGCSFQKCVWSFKPPEPEEDEEEVRSRRPVVSIRTALTEMPRAGKEGEEEGRRGRSLRERKGRVHVQAEARQER